MMVQGMAVTPSLCVGTPLAPDTRLPRPSYEREVQARTDPNYSTQESDSRAVDQPPHPEVGSLVKGKSRPHGGPQTPDETAGPRGGGQVCGERR